MKHIAIPDHRIPVNKDDGTPSGIEVDFAWFVRGMLRVDARFNGMQVREKFYGYAGVRSALKIDQALTESNGVLILEDADYALLAEACAEPSNGYPMRPALVLGPYLDAVANATEKRPSDVVAEMPRKKR